MPLDRRKRRNLRGGDVVPGGLLSKDRIVGLMSAPNEMTGDTQALVNHAGTGAALNWGITSSANSSIERIASSIGSVWKFTCSDA